MPLVHSSSTPQSLSTPLQNEPLPLLQPLSPSQPQSSAALDSDEQFMFEQRLTSDELGVAVRKINSSGKAQLRYVRCVPLRPVSSSDYQEGGMTMNTSMNTMTVDNNKAVMSLPYLDNDNTAGGYHNNNNRGDNVSVSSRSTASSVRFLEKIRNGVFDVKKPFQVVTMMNHDKNNANNNNNGGIGSIGGVDDTRALDHNSLLKEETTSKALSWGKKNVVTVPLHQFVAVKKGKTTERTVRSAAPASRLLSIVTRSKKGCLDVEAPTRLDRDKFASAFSVFLNVPLEEEKEERDGNNGFDAATRSGSSVGRKKLRTPSLTRDKKQPKQRQHVSAAYSEPGLLTTPSASSHSSTPKVRNPSQPPLSGANTDPSRNNGNTENNNILPALTPNSEKASDDDKELTFFDENKSKTSSKKNTIASTPGTASMGGDTMSASARKRILSIDTKSESMLDPPDDAKPTAHAAAHDPIKSEEDDAGSHVSSLTGAVDQEIVEELHQAIIELRSELDASRAEAARAVKVAEQAIQSAENCSSSDWNSTVTHKAAEAAALAQKKSAEAIARARMAEERLSAERKSTAFWRRQAQAAEEEAGSLKTRSAAAEIHQGVMVEELASERRRAARMFASLKEIFGRGDERQARELESALDRRRELEVELERLRGVLEKKNEEMKEIKEEQERKEKPKSGRMGLSFSSRRKRQSSASSVEEQPSVADTTVVSTMDAKEQAVKDKTMIMTTSLATLQKQFALLRHTTKDELLTLQSQSKEWSHHAKLAISASVAETSFLKEKLAAESAMRLKLLNELQDIRGTVRVYCRPKPPVDSKSILKIPTHDILVLNEEDAPMSFKFDRVFAPHASQYEVFSELEEPLISSLDGFNVTLMAFGQHGSGKTHSVLGSLESHGVQLQALKQLFNIAEHRTDRFKDAVSVTILEVHNEKLIDLLSGTPSADESGQVIIHETRRDKRRKNNDLNSEWHKGKMEIQTNIDGNTVVQGLVSIPIQSFEHASAIWREVLAKRAERLKQCGLDPSTYEKNSNVITTFNITSVNIATGVGTEGKLQFVDMAASDIAHGVKKMEDAATTNDDTLHFSDKSIDALNDVVNARCQFHRSVPYRNSTLTHLLGDSLEADTKVLMLCCVKSDPADLSDTIGILQFADRMQKVSIGKATKHVRSV